MRRGQAEFMEWFPRLMLLLAAVIVIALLVRFFAEREIDAGLVHRETYLARLYYDDIIMYEDPTTGRVYPGVIDKEKFTPTRINEVYGVTGKISSKLMLTGCYETTIYHDKTVYDLNLPKAKNFLQGDGGATVTTALFPVTIKQDNCAATLNITIVRPNS